MLKHIFNYGNICVSHSSNLHVLTVGGNQSTKRKTKQKNRQTRQSCSQSLTVRDSSVYKSLKKTKVLLTLLLVRKSFGVVKKN